MASSPSKLVAIFPDFLTALINYLARSSIRIRTYLQTSRSSRSKTVMARHLASEAFTSGVQQRGTLDVMEFAEARATELHSVAAILDPQDIATMWRRPARQNKRLLRRRTGSSVVWRWRSRKPMPRDLRSKLAGNSRRDKRRAATLRARTASLGGLETEAWHAKRFHMARVFGIRLPWRAHDRSVMSAVRAVNETCTLHDASYRWRCLVMQGDPERLLDVLTRSTDVAGSLRERLRPGREVACMLHQVRNGHRERVSCSLVPHHLVRCY